MNIFNEIKQSVIVSVWFMFLTFPILVIKVNPLDSTINWRWKNMVAVGITTFIGSFFWRHAMRVKEQKAAASKETHSTSAISQFLSEPQIFYPLIGVLITFTIIFPFIFSSYQTSIITTALIYVILGLGLNIVVGLAGLLDLGYVAFYAVGAYFYALLNHHFGFSFWFALPLGALLAAIFGIILGFPVLRLRGDYLAIVTLGFGEIIRLVLENWDKVFLAPVVYQELINLISLALRCYKNQFHTQLLLFTSLFLPWFLLRYFSSPG